MTTHAIVTKPFKGAPDGELYPKEFSIGDEVTGDLAAVAIKEKWAEVPSAQKSMLGADENKALTNAPENKRAKKSGE